MQKRSSTFRSDVRAIGSSAFVIPGNQAEKAILKIIEEHDSLLISMDIIKEVLSVLSSKCGRDREGLSHVAVTLSELAELVKPAKWEIFWDVPEQREPPKNPQTNS